MGAGRPEPERARPSDLPDVPHASSLSARTRLRDPAAVLGPASAIASSRASTRPTSPRSSSPRRRMVAAIPQWTSVIALVDPSAGRPVVNTSARYGTELPAARDRDVIAQVAERREPDILTRYAGGSATGRPRQRRPLACRSSATARYNSVLVAASGGEGPGGRAGRRPLADLLSVRPRRARPHPRPVRAIRATSSASEADARGSPRRRKPCIGPVRGSPISTTQPVFTGLRALAPDRVGQRSLATDHQRLEVARPRARPGPSSAPARSASPCRASSRVFLFYNVVERRVTDERLRRLPALSALDARLLATTQQALVGAAQVLLRARGPAARDLSPREEQPADRPEPPAPRLPRPQRRTSASPSRAPSAGSAPWPGCTRSSTSRPISPRSTSRTISKTSSGRPRKGSAPTCARSAPRSRPKSMRVPLDTAVPLAFITVEILTNAFKHAFPDRAVWDDRGEAPGRTAITASLPSPTTASARRRKRADDAARPQPCPEARPNRSAGRSTRRRTGDPPTASSFPSCRSTSRRCRRPPQPPAAAPRDLDTLPEPSILPAECRGAGSHHRSAANLGLRTCRVSRPSGIRFFWASTRSSRRSTASPRPPGTAIRPTISSVWRAPSTIPERLRITLAVAGFTRDQLEVTRWRRTSSSSGARQTDDKTRHFLHRGIAARQFQRTFLLADGMEVMGADLSNGLLSIDLVRPEPERIVRKIDIMRPRTRRDGAAARRTS